MHLRLLALVRPSLYPSLAVILPAAAQRPAFEVASIKPGIPESHLIRSVITPGGRLRAENVSLRTLIEDAYQILPIQLTGGPGWMDDAKFEILAKSDTAATADQVRLMLQVLLEDRFRLVLRREVKEQTISRLTVKGEPRMSQSPENARFRFGTRVGNGALNQVIFQATSMARLAEMLSRQLGHMVEDRTGLSGAFDFEFDASRTTISIRMSSLRPGLPRSVSLGGILRLLRVLWEFFGN